MKNDVRAEFKRIVKKHKSNPPNEGKKDYYEIKEQIKADLMAFVRLDFCTLTTGELLQLNYFIYSYSVMQIHSWGILCERQLNLLNTK